MKKEKSIEDVHEYVKRVAEKRGWKVNPNTDGTLDMLIEGLTSYFNRIGYFNCPCRDSNEDRMMDRDISCPCDYAQADIDEHERCYCALFYKKGYDFSIPTLEMIPERRPMEKW